MVTCGTMMRTVFEDSDRAKPQSMSCRTRRGCVERGDLFAEPAPGKLAETNRPDSGDSSFFGASCRPGSHSLGRPVTVRKILPKQWPRVNDRAPDASPRFVALAPPRHSSLSRSRCDRSGDGTLQLDYYRAHEWAWRAGGTLGKAPSLCLGGFTPSGYVCRGR
jgi:hypothetical protein